MCFPYGICPVQRPLTAARMTVQVSCSEADDVGLLCAVTQSWATSKPKLMRQRSTASTACENKQRNGHLFGQFFVEWTTSHSREPFVIAPIHRTLCNKRPTSGRRRRTQHTYPTTDWAAAAAAVTVVAEVTSSQQCTSSRHPFDCDCLAL